MKAPLICLGAYRNNIKHIQSRFADEFSNSYDEADLLLVKFHETSSYILQAIIFLPCVKQLSRESQEKLTSDKPSAFKRNLNLT